MGEHSRATELNKSYFNDEAANYDAKHERSQRQLTESIQSRLNFIGADWLADDDEVSEKPVRLLDYACGTGMVSRALAPYTTQCVGIDISENMVKTYNKRTANQGLTKEDMYAVVGDLSVVDDPRPAVLDSAEFFDFELAAVGGGFHHFENPTLIATRLVERLRPGGVLVIWDFLTHEADEHHNASSTVLHHGFSEEEIRKIFTTAGAERNFALEDLGGGVIVGHGSHGMKRHVFLARGEKSE
ncbi:S-adenosyl-L-methionine-dependent methyltransferase [Xylariales sp. PMI_506]|nr:S-adenosyl-L-methionine-dependent methyltransferase [Xylariales sp. PMI_506]